MFGFISNFKKDVVAGFDAVHQRLISLEVKVEALFAHTKETVVADVPKAEAVVSTATAVTEAVAKPVEAAVVAAVSEVVPSIAKKAD